MSARCGTEWAEFVDIYMKKDLAHEVESVVGRRRASVTVGIPTRSRRRYLEVAVESVLKNLEAGDQLIIADNASEDDTAEYLSGLTDRRIEIIRHQSDIGMVANWNSLLARARGDYFLLLSDDDSLLTGALGTLRDALDEPSVAIAYGRARVVDATGAVVTFGHLAPKKEQAAEFVSEWGSFRRSIYPCSLMCRTQDLQKIDGFSAKFGPFADVGAWMGILSNLPGGLVRFCRDFVADYRVHPQAVSTTGTFTGIEGLYSLAAEFPSVSGVNMHYYFAAMRAHFVSSAIRRQAAATRLKLIVFIYLLFRSRVVVRENWSLRVYSRQFLIIALPKIYEWSKRRKSQAI
jgi:glycosyltransferase involved in cell wall biosynthesis